MNKELIEAFTMRHGWTPEAVLSIAVDDVKKMTEEELQKYFSAMMELTDMNSNINEIPAVDGDPVYSKEAWD